MLDEKVDDKLIDALLFREQGLVLKSEGDIITVRGVDLARYRDWKSPDNCYVIGVDPDAGGDPYFYTDEVCRACASLPASVCLVCARYGKADCSHPQSYQLEPMYCDHCAVIYPQMAGGVDELDTDFLMERDEAGAPRGLNEADFHHTWIHEQIDAPQDQIDRIAGWEHGWKTEDGEIWPLPDA